MLLCLLQHLKMQRPAVDVSVGGLCVITVLTIQHLACGSFNIVSTYISLVLLDL